MNNENFESFFKTINFKKDKTIKGHQRSNFCVYSGTIESEKVILKIARIDYELKKTQFEKEILIGGQIQGYNKNHPKINAVKIINHGNNQNFRWVIRSFANGKSLSDFNPNASLLGYDVINKKFLRFRDKIISQIKILINSIKEIEKTDENNQSMSSRYQNNINDYDILAIEKYLNIELKEQQEFFDKNFLLYSDKKYTKLSIGDLTPSNLIIDNSGNFVMSDYELFSFDNCLMDITYLWLFLWRYPDWQKKLLEDIIVSETDQIFFRMNVIKILGLLYNWPFNCVSNMSSKKRKNLNNKHIWKKYLIAAGESFEAITKV